MDFVVNQLAKRKNTIITSLKGFERSRVLLKAELHLLSNAHLLGLVSSQPTECSESQLENSKSFAQPKPDISFKRIYHVVDDDDLLLKIYNETQQMPFADLELGVARLFSNTNPLGMMHKSDSSDWQRKAPLVLVHVRHLFHTPDEASVISQPDTARINPKGAIFVFDGVALERIEDLSCTYNLQPLQISMSPQSKKARMSKFPFPPPIKAFLECPDAKSIHSAELALSGTTESTNQCSFFPGFGFCAATSNCWALLIACEPPVEGLEHELCYRFEYVRSSAATLSSGTYRLFSSIITDGQSSSEVTKPAIQEHARLVIQCLQRIGPAHVIVVLRDFVHVAYYEKVWKEMDAFEKFGFKMFADTGMGSQAKRKLLVNFNQHPTGKAVLLTSYVQNENSSLVEYVFSSAKIIMFVGLPKPCWTGDPAANTRAQKRQMFSNERSQRKTSPSTALNGYDLVFHRSAQRLNGFIRKCVGEFRWNDCGIFFVSQWLANASDKLTSELADVRSESFIDAMERFERFCHL